MITINHQKKPFDDVRVRRASDPGYRPLGQRADLSKIAMCTTVGSIVFPGSPLAPTKEELEKIAGFWPDIEKSRAEARRLLKEAGAEGLTFELLNRNVDQPYKYVGIWLVDEWSKIGLHVTQRVLPTGPWFQAARSGDFAVDLAGNCHSIVNPLIDVQPYLPQLGQPAELRLLRRPEGDRALRGDAARDRSRKKQRELMLDFVQARDGRRGPHAVAAVVVPDCAAALLRQWLEDQSEPLRQPRSGDGLARRASMRGVHRLTKTGRIAGGLDKAKAGKKARQAKICQ